MEDIRALLKEQTIEITASVTAKIEEKFEEKFNRFAVELTAKVEGELQTQERRHQEQLLAIRADFTNQLNALEARQEQSERAAVANNVVIIGVPEGNDQQQLTTLLPANATRTGFQRLGRANPGAAKPRPLRVTFTSSDAKHAAFSKSKDLRQRKIFITDDLTKAQRDSRTARRAEFQHYRDHGQIPFWRGDRLFLAGENGSRREVHSPPAGTVPAPSGPAAPAARGRADQPSNPAATPLPTAPAPSASPMAVG
jgi:hypothetical protein